MPTCRGQGTPSPGSSPWPGVPPPCLPPPPPPPPPLRTREGRCRLSREPQPLLARSFNHLDDNCARARERERKREREKEREREREREFERERERERERRERERAERERERERESAVCLFLTESAGIGALLWTRTSRPIVKQDTRQRPQDLGPGRDGIGTTSTALDGGCRIVGLYLGPPRCDSPSQFMFKSVGHQSMVCAGPSLSDSGAEEAGCDSACEYDKLKLNIFYIFQRVSKSAFSMCCT